MAAVAIDPRYTPNHTIDPATGFLECNAYPSAFDAERKLDFLKIYRANGLMFYKTCKQLGLSTHTVNKAIKIDEAFKVAVDDAQREYAEELESKSRNIALTKDSATLERIFHLRALFPEKYARELKSDIQQTTINITGDIVFPSRQHLQSIEQKVTRELEDQRPIIDAIVTQSSTQAAVLPSSADSSREQLDREGPPL